MFPKPATDYANIQYTLENDAKVATVVVLDMQGKVVFEESVQNQTKGAHTIRLNTASLNAGSYFYQVRANGAKLTKELVITK